MDDFYALCENKYDDDDDDDIDNKFESGQWIWDDNENQLSFIRDVYYYKFNDAYSGSIKYSDEIKFNEDIDVLKKLYFVENFQRKCSGDKPQIITLQDVKDVVLFTAPEKILNVYIINILHTSSYDRFLRGLIVYIQYFIQATIIMKHRTQEALNKIRTPISDEKEYVIADDLFDLRAIVAKDYFYFMFVDEHVKKKRSSLFKQDIKIMEAIITLSTQMVWISLGRLNHNIIAHEISRFIRSDLYNLSLHRSNNIFSDTMTNREKNILHSEYKKNKKLDIINGSTKHRFNKFKTISPAAEAFLNFRGDIRLLAFNCCGFETTDDRFKQLNISFSASEEELFNLGLSVGILGQVRSKYDELLMPLLLKKDKASDDQSSVSTLRRNSTLSSIAKSSISTKGSIMTSNLFKIIILPLKSDYEKVQDLPHLPLKYIQTPPDEIQKIKWIKKYQGCY